MHGMDNFKKCLLDVMNICGQAQNPEFFIVGGEGLTLRPYVIYV